MRASLRIGALLATLALALLSGCWVEPDSISGPRDMETDPTELERVEIREYEGNDLSSVTDFRENSIDGPQYVDIETYRLTVDGLVSESIDLTYDEVLDRQRFSKVVRLNCVEGWSVDILWEGVLLADLLEQAGYDEMANVVIFHAVDGYSTSLPLDYLIQNEILLAYRMNGVEMPPERGYPFQLVAEDRWGYKWIKWIDHIEVSSDTSFEGYWESRGYSNDALLGGGD